jgi:hypothetical protein
VDIPTYAGYALRVTPCCNATETRHKTMCQAKQELSQPLTQPASHKEVVCQKKITFYILILYYNIYEHFDN